MGEKIGYKSGLALTREQLQEILIEESEAADYLTFPDDHPIAIRTEEFEEAYSIILYRLGAAPTPSVRAYWDIASHHKYKKIKGGLEVWKGVVDLFNSIIPLEITRAAETDNKLIDPTEFMTAACNEFGKLGLDIAVEILQKFDNYLVFNPWSSLRRIEWREIRDLDDLFQSEKLKAEYGKFFDQRFINYLYKNFNCIDSIHWRQFEGLSAEYFDRLGYTVELGPGRNDEGVDIRLWDKDSNTGGPPLVLVQCKRQKSKIEKVVIKALWADVLAEKAESGLIVTTSSLSPGSQDTLRARGYAIEQAQRDTLRQWLQQLQTPGTGIFLGE
jgi:restriction system protein